MVGVHITQLFKKENCMFLIFYVYFMCLIVYFYVILVTLSFVANVSVFKTSVK